VQGISAKRWSWPNIPFLGVLLKFRLLPNASLSWLALLQAHLYYKICIMSESVMLDQKRYDELEALYVKDGRDKHDHPMHSLYTGLYQAHLAGIAVEASDVGKV